MSPTHDLRDPDLEADLRALLQARAGRIAGPPPAVGRDLARPKLETAAPIALTPVRPSHARSGGRRHQLAAAAAAIVVLATVAAALAWTTTERTADSVRTAPQGGGWRPAGLPSGFELESALRLYRIERAKSPSAVVRSYLADRLGNGTTPSKETARSLVLARHPERGAFVRIDWKRRGETVIRGSVYAKVGKRGIDIVAATTPGVSVASVRRKNSLIVGRANVWSHRLAPPALVDVALFGHGGMPSFGILATTTVPVPHTGRLGFGSTAVGEDEFHVDTGGAEAVVAVRFATDRVEAITEVQVPAADGSKYMPDFRSMTPQERREFMDKSPANRACQAADELPPPVIPFSFPAVAVEPAHGTLQDPTGATPAGAVQALATSLGIELTPGPFTTVDDRSGTYQATTSGGAAVEILVIQTNDSSTGWRILDATTIGGCNVAGHRDLNPGSSPPRARYTLPRIKGARSGRVWFTGGRNGGGAFTAGVTTEDLAKTAMALPAESDDITSVAVVLRNDQNKVVLVDLRD